MNALHSPEPLLCDAKPRLGKILVSLLVFVVLADWLFYGKALGISVAVATVEMVGLVIWNRPDWKLNWATGSLGLLLLGTIVQAGLELSFSCLFFTGALLLGFVGDSFYTALLPRWTRWMEAVIAFGKAFGRWAWLTQEIRQQDEQGALQTGARNVSRGWKVVTPSLLLVIPFGLLLGGGNAIFGRWLSEAAHFSWAWLTALSFPSWDRLGLWVLSATLMLVGLQPAAAPVMRRYWIETPPLCAPPADARISWWRSLFVLILMNLLFLVANGIDAFFLWRKTELPEGISYSGFVHQGVYHLIATVLLSAVVLVLLFRQHWEIVRSRWLQGLALLWIAQDLFLVSSVGMRLKLYVDAHDLTELRVGVGCFLLLVTVGFVLLSVHIARHTSLRWLVLRNAVATFALFYGLQFADLRGGIAEINVSRWQLEPKRALDTAYLETLGPPAWRALLRVAADPRALPATAEARKILASARAAEQNRSRPWQGWQWRRSLWAQQLLREFPASEVRL